MMMVLASIQLWTTTLSVLAHQISLAETGCFEYDDDDDQDDGDDLQDEDYLGSSVSFCV